MDRPTDDDNDTIALLDGLLVYPAEQRATLDVAKYEHLLDDENLSENEKRQLLEALWTIICTFVDLGFGVHPMQNIDPKVDGPCIEIDGLFARPDDPALEVAEESEDG